MAVILVADGELAHLAVSGVDEPEVAVLSLALAVDAADAKEHPLAIGRDFALGQGLELIEVFGLDRAFGGAGHGGFPFWG